MKYQYYTAAYVADDLSIFEFISSGKHGHIRKRILFQPTDMQGVYNLAFGDLSPEGEIDDQTISNNGDRDKILATIVRAFGRPLYWQISKTMGIFNGEYEWESKTLSDGGDIAFQGIIREV